MEPSKEWCVVLSTTHVTLYRLFDSTCPPQFLTIPYRIPHRSRVYPPPPPRSSCERPRVIDSLRDKRVTQVACGGFHSLPPPPAARVSVPV